MKIRTLIVDDEPLGRGGISARLKGEPDIEIVGECANGRRAVEAVFELSPDLLFLDVQMPGMSGFDVLEAIGERLPPLTILVTAYDEYALRAFEVHALDYLLKPIDDERFKRSLQHARALLAQKRESLLGKQLAALLADLKTESRTGREASGSGRFVIKSAGRIFFVRTSEIDWIEADRDYVLLHVGTQVHLLRETMAAMEARLGGGFLRVHRSVIVNAERIKELQPWFNGEYKVILTDGTQLKSGRGYRDRLRQHFGAAL